MSLLPRIRWWLKRHLGRERIAREVEEDIRTHIELDAERLRREGVPADEALRRARERFGNRDDIRAEMLRIAAGGAAPPRRRTVLETVSLHVRHALRSLRATPGATALVATTLALAVAVHTLTLAVADAVFLGDGGAADPSRILAIHGYFASLAEGQKEQPLNGGQVELILDAGSAEAVAGFTADYFNLTGRGRPRRLNGLRATSELFEVAGVRPLLGPGFADVTTGEERVVVLSWRLWRELGADPALLGSSLRLNAQPYEIVGVMPEGFSYGWA
ncbi:MAG: ABC transporter permease, partial [Gemmatimonadota bacterium]